MIYNNKNKSENKQVDDLKKLKQKSIMGIFWDLAGSFSHQGIGLIISIILARLLSPEEFGLVGMALVFIFVFQVFADFGFASALIQNRTNRSLTYSSVFYLNIVAGITLFLLFQFFAEYVGRFYGSSEVAILIKWLSLNFIFSSFSIVQKTILGRKIDFKALTIRSIISTLISGVVGIILALQGYGVYALVVQNLLASFLNTLLLWSVSSWYPKLEFSWAEIKSLTGFSVYVFLAQSLNRLTKRIDILVIGKFYSPAILGYYSRAQSLESLVAKYSSTSITRVFFPVLSKIQEDKILFEGIYFKVLHVISFLSILITGILFIAGKDIILLLFGMKWQPSVVLFQIIIIKAFNYPISALIVNVFMAKGKSKQNFWYGNIRKAIKLSIIPFAFFVDYTWFVVIIVIYAFVGWAFNNYVISREEGFSLIRQFKSVGTYIIPTSVFIGLILILRMGFGYNSIGYTIVYLSVFTCFYFLYHSFFKSDGYVYLKANLKEQWKILKLDYLRN